MYRHGLGPDVVLCCPSFWVFLKDFLWGPAQNVRFVSLSDRYQKDLFIGHPQA